MSGRAEAYSAADFRAELAKIMPGFKWTVHRASKGAVRLTATGIQSSGFNRLCTLRVERSIDHEMPWYAAKFAGHGTRAAFVAESGDRTLARALRGLQVYCQSKANEYLSLVRKLEAGRRTVALEDLAALKEATQ